MSRSRHGVLRVMAIPELVGGARDGGRVGDVHERHAQSCRDVDQEPVDLLEECAAGRVLTHRGQSVRMVWRDIGDDAHSACPHGRPETLEPGGATLVPLGIGDPATLPAILDGATAQPAAGSVVQYRP